MVKPAENLVEVADLSVFLPTGKASGVQAVRTVSLTIAAGERVGIVGESGSGKTITGRAIAGLLPDIPGVKVGGSIKFGGRQLLGASETLWRKHRAQNVGVIFQDPLTYLNPTMRIGRQVAEAIPFGGYKDRSQIPHLVEEALLLSGLNHPKDIAHSYPHELSGGMRQRVLIALAIIKEPALIIADEPTTALDATVQQVVLDNLATTVDKMGAALMLISHDLAVVSQMTDRIYVMYRGKVVEQGLTEQILRKPQHSYTQALVRSMRSLTSEEEELYSIPSALRATWEEEV